MKSDVLEKNSNAVFKDKLAQYKSLIDSDIEEYCSTIDARTLKTYGAYSQIVSKAYTDILSRGGKRIRGVLTCVGYEMCGGTDNKMIIQAARAIEMMHAYMLIVDDIQDRAELRRRGSSAHKMLEASHRQYKWKGDPAHTGVSLALNSALLGSHGASLVLSSLEVDPELRLKALNIMNHTMIVTAHGQTNDIANEIIQEVPLSSIETVMQWKTAHYSFLNPIHMGMVLAGASCEDTNAITQYALNLGKAFQITDDLMVVSDQKNTGKNPIDDIREGKQTLLTAHALKNSPDAIFLKKCLGNQQLNLEDFERCKEVLSESGAVSYARKAADDYVKTARESLEEHAERWDRPSVVFLDGLAQYILERTK